MDTDLSRKISKIGMEYSKLKPYLKWMNLSDRKIVVNSKLRSILDYGLPLYMGETEEVRSKLESSYMTLKRIIHGGLTFKVSKVKICDYIKEEPPEKHILKVAAKYIHTHLHFRKSSALIEELILPKRSASIIYMKNPQIGTYSASLDKLVNIYNMLPQNAKTMNPAKFKRYLKKNEVKT